MDRPSQPALSTSSEPENYHFTQDVRNFCQDLIKHSQELSHIDTKQLLFAWTPAHKRKRHGIYATCMPLRFENGSTRKRLGEQTWEWTPLIISGHEILYCISFYLPRFLNLSKAQKLETVIHELFHISPDFNGDLRRFGKGRWAYHGPSLKHYQALLQPIVQQAKTKLQLENYCFYTHSMGQLRKRFDRIVGEKTKKLRPKLLP